jgi:pyruvate dehydrogenase E1 component beta subunit
MVPQALKAAETLASEGISSEVIDVRALEPFDVDTLVRSVQKTGKAVIVHEACRKGGFGAEIAASIQELTFEHLKKPVKRIGAPFVPVPFGPNLEKCFLPDSTDVIDAVHSIM